MWILANPLDEYEHIRSGLDINPIIVIQMLLTIKDMLRHRDTMIFENIFKKWHPGSGCLWPGI